VRRLVIVSNRLPRAGAAGSRGPIEPLPGGLISALFGAASRYPECLWFGWNGRAADRARTAPLTRQSIRGIDLAGFPLAQEDVDGYYLGFCNETLWPLLHCFQGRVRIHPEQETSYRRVQIEFARRLLPLLDPNDVVWVHDYHLILLGRELRRLGWHGSMGFFLHTPFPPHEHWQLLPEPREYLDAMLSFDLIGFQTKGSLDNYVRCSRRELEARWDGDVLTALGQVQRAGVYPVGIDPRAFRPGPERAPAATRARGLIPALRDRRLILGVDRLDYTKGIPERILAFEHFLRAYPAWLKQVVYVQVASPSRASVPEYMRQKRRVDALIGRINGEFGEHDWVPIRYLYRSYPQEFLAELYREAAAMLVTPLRDGMNLVAKEFVASQDPASPGVLILSRCAGAADEMREALIVNPLVYADVAAGINRALSMPPAERRWRHEVLFSRILTGRASEWGRRFVEDLSGYELGDPSTAATRPPAGADVSARA
jgi:trehalose 6-phosphate synthase